MFVSSAWKMVCRAGAVCASRAPWPLRDVPVLNALLFLCRAGVFAFWAGTWARLPRVAFGQSIALSFYDHFMNGLNALVPEN